MQPLVTIAIPTYKRLSYLKECLASALSQSYADIEILIGQDPATDGPDKEIKEWIVNASKEHNNVKYFCNEKNLGLSGNWNALASKASGEYIMIIGDDDRLLSDAVEKLIAAILPDNNVAFANHYLIDKSGNRLEQASKLNTVNYKRDKLKPGLINSSEKIIWQNAVPMSASLIKTSDVKRLKFKEDLNTPEIEFFLRLSKDGGKFLFTPDYIMEFRVHQESATSSGLKIHYLLRYLLPMEVSKETESFKKTFIQSLIGPAVTRLIREGNIKEAKEIYNSKYYPLILKFMPAGIVQFLFIYFPGITTPLFNFLFKKK